MGLVSDGELGMMILRRGRILEFFHEEEKVELEKDKLMRAVRCGWMEGPDSLSMYSNMCSGPVLLV